jgi:hypothetical protein
MKVKSEGGAIRERRPGRRIAVGWLAIDPDQGSRRDRRDYRCRLPAQEAAEGEPTSMTPWIVRAVWKEDEAEAAEQWEVRAPTALDAIRIAATHFRYQPHHVEVRRSVSGSKGDVGGSARAGRVSHE